MRPCYPASWILGGGSSLQLLSEPIFPYFPPIPPCFIPPVLISATSKASSNEEMQNASTYGFRGEALYSLGLTSMLEIQSRCAGKESHAKVGCRKMCERFCILRTGRNNPRRPHLVRRVLALEKRFLETLTWTLGRECYTPKDGVATTSARRKDP